jgi:hypothetical protein
MTKAIVKEVNRYEDQYGSGVELVLYSEPIGEYKTKRKIGHKDFSWISALCPGNFVDLVENTKGKGYYVNKIKGVEYAQNEETTEEIFNSFNKDLANAEVSRDLCFEDNALEYINKWFLVESLVRPKAISLGYNNEDIRCITTSIIIGVK